MRFNHWNNVNIHRILGLKWIHSPVSALFPKSAELHQKTTKPNWWASREKCPWSHLNRLKFPTGRFLINLRLRSSPYPHRISLISNHDGPDVYIGSVRKGSPGSQCRNSPCRYSLHESDSDLWFVIHGICVGGFMFLSCSSERRVESLPGEFYCFFCYKWFHLLQVIISVLT